MMGNPMHMDNGPMYVPVDVPLDGQRMPKGDDVFPPLGGNLMPMDNGPVGFSF